MTLRALSFVPILCTQSSPIQLLPAPPTQQQVPAHFGAFLEGTCFKCSIHEQSMPVSHPRQGYVGGEGIPGFAYMHIHHHPFLEGLPLRSMGRRRECRGQGKLSSTHAQHRPTSAFIQVPGFLLRRDRVHVVFVQPIDAPSFLGLKADEDAGWQLVPYIPLFSGLFSSPFLSILCPDPCNHSARTPTQNSAFAV